MPDSPQVLSSANNPAVLHVCACWVPDDLWPLVHVCSWELDVWEDRDDPFVSLATHLAGPWPSLPPLTQCYAGRWATNVVNLSRPH